MCRMRVCNKSKMLLVFFCVILPITDSRTYKAPTAVTKSVQYSSNKDSVSTVITKSMMKNFIRAVILDRLSYKERYKNLQESKRKVKRLISSDFLENVDPNFHDYYYDRVPDDLFDEFYYNKEKSSSNVSNGARSFSIPKAVNGDVSDLSYEMKGRKSTTDSSESAEQSNYNKYRDTTYKPIVTSTESEIAKVSKKVDSAKVPGKKIQEKQKIQRQPGALLIPYNIYKYKDYISSEESDNVKVLVVTRLPEKLLEKSPFSYLRKATTMLSPGKDIKYSVSDYPSQNGYGKSESVTKKDGKNTTVTDKEETHIIVKETVPDNIKDEAMFIEQRVKDSLLFKTNASDILKYDILKPLPKITDY